jgi:hypothetical protein
MTQNLSFSVILDPGGWRFYRVRAIVGFAQGNPQSCRVVRAPTPEEKDAPYPKGKNDAMGNEQT